MKHLSAAVAVVGLLVAPAVASATTSQNRESVSIAVKSSDLDLNRPEHVAKLRTRVARAIAAACNPGDRMNADTSPDRQCRSEMGVTAESAMNRMIGSSRSQVASN